MNALTVKELYTLEETIAKDLFDKVTYPWEVLPNIGSFIKELGNTLSSDEYEKRGEDVWIAKSAKVAPTACINGPAIIGKEAEVRHCAFIRGNAIVGEGAVVGNSTELKNVVLFNKVQVPHYNYVGDSVLGYKSHMGAGSITSNVKSDKKLVVIPTKTIPPGITAMINFELTRSAHENEKAMLESLSTVKSGQLTYAVRDTSIDGKEIKKDNYLGLGDKGLASVGTDMDDTLIDMLSEFVDDESELISVYYGEDIDENKAEELVSKIEEKFDGVDVELQYGGQPVYYYIVSVE